MAKERPIDEILLGRIRAAIWANRDGQNHVWFSVTVARLYRQDDEWKDSASFGRDDLPIVAKAMDMAYDRIWKLQATSGSGKEKL